MPDLKLLEWATPAEAKYLKAAKKHGSARAAARAMKCHPSTVTYALKRVKRRAAAKGYAPEIGLECPVPDGLAFVGASTLYGKGGFAGGEIKGQWVKNSRDREQDWEIFQEAVTALMEPWRGTSPKIKAPKNSDKDLLAVYPMGDPHLGMLADMAEVGEGFDLPTAERNLIATVDALVELAPSAHTALIVNLGDFFHADNADGKTARSGHVLDVDIRYSHMIKAGLRAMRRTIEGALTKHKEVRVVCEIGNHDSHSALWLAMALEQLYENNKRVVVDTSPDPFHWYRHGKCLFGITHGDGLKVPDLPGIMAHDRPKDWGETEYRYWLTGHIHHLTRKEVHGVLIESFRTMAPRDYYHHKAGYRAGRSMEMIVYHREFGEVLRHTVGIGRL